MKDLLERIVRAQNLNDLLPLVDDLSRETDAIMDLPQISAEDLQRVLRPFETIRMLLSRLDLQGAGPEEDRRQTEVIRDLVRRCLDVEGKVKEARNDHIRAGAARSA